MPSGSRLVRTFLIPAGATAMIAGLALAQPPRREDGDGPPPAGRPPEGQGGRYDAGPAPGEGRAGCRGKSARADDGPPPGGRARSRARAAYRDGGPDGPPPPPPFDREGDGPPPPPGPRGRLMKALDTDGDGVLSAAEVRTASESLKALDMDRDGTLSEEELRPTGPPPPPPGRPRRRPGPPGFGPG